MTTAQALATGLTRDQLRALTANGWGHPTRGVYVAPDAPNPFRASVWGALLVRPDGVTCRVTAARVLQLWGLPEWTPEEHPQLILPAGCTYNHRTGVGLHAGLKPDERTTCNGLPVTTLARTVRDMASLLELDDLVCLLDSALRAGWQGDLTTHGTSAKLHSAMALADVRSESTFETLLRLLLVRAGLAPEALQLELFEKNGRVYARLDLAWPRAKVAVEADGRKYHDAPQALYRDRVRANDLALDGWTILRFTWADLLHRPQWIVSQVRRALNPEAGVSRAS